MKQGALKVLLAVVASCSCSVALSQGSPWTDGPWVQTPEYFSLPDSHGIKRLSEVVHEYSASEDALVPKDTHFVEFDREGNISIDEHPDFYVDSSTSRIWYTVDTVLVDSSKNKVHRKHHRSDSSIWHEHERLVGDSTINYFLEGGDTIKKVVRYQNGGREIEDILFYGRKKDGYLIEKHRTKNIVFDKKFLFFRSKGVSKSIEYREEYQRTSKFVYNYLSNNVIIIEKENGRITEKVKRKFPMNSEDYMKPKKVIKEEYNEQGEKFFKTIITFKYTDRGLVSDMKYNSDRYSPIDKKRVFSYSFFDN